MAKNMHEFVRGRKCVYMFIYIYAGIGEMKMQKKEEGKHMSKAMCTSIGTVT